MNHSFLNLSAKHIEFLNNIPEAKIILEKNNFYLDLSIIDELREVCIKEFDNYGYNENYELTEQGEILESLIDKLWQ